MPGTPSQPDAHTERKRKLRSAINALDLYVPDAPSSSRQALAKRLSELRDYIEQEDDEGVRVYLQDLHYDSIDIYPRLARALSRFARTIYGERITELALPLSR